MDEAMADCPRCGEPTDHRVLKATPNNVTLQCETCGDTRTMTIPKVRVITLKLVISHEGEAWNDTIETPRDEVIEVGHEFELGDHRLIVTGIEIDGKTVDKTEAEAIKVLHAKVFDTVPLKFSVNEGDTTSSYRIDVDPDRFVSIGEVFEVQGRKIAVKTIKSDQNRTLHKLGLPARNIVRCFCDDAPFWANEGKILKTRRRGLPVGQKSDKPANRVKGKRSGYAKRR